MPRLPRGMTKEEWQSRLTAEGLPLKYIPSPIMIRRLMLSSAGAWANFEGTWNYPTVVSDRLGYQAGLSLEQWQHIITQGRDQFVKTVTKAFLCDTGHLVSIVTIKERQFNPYSTPNGQTGSASSPTKISIYRSPRTYEKLRNISPCL